MALIAALGPLVAMDSYLRLALVGGLFLVGISISALGFFEFRRAKTTINPVNPNAASSVVTSGIFRFTRNPMYLGFTSILLSWAMYLAAPWSLLGPIGFG